MSPCTDPAGHDWEDTSFTVARDSGGSTPVECRRCGEPGYRLGGDVREPFPGLPGEELF